MSFVAPAHQMKDRDMAFEQYPPSQLDQIKDLHGHIAGLLGYFCQRVDEFGHEQMKIDTDAAVDSFRNIDLPSVSLVD